MQKENKVVIKKDCHSRSSSRSVSVRDIAGIYNACCYHNKEKTLLNKCVEDPRLRHSGMTPLLTAARGFTLIELLVVVLIIGILAAVALPQYKKAVEKSRLTEAYTMVDALRKSMELHILNHGTETYNLFAQNPEESEIEIQCSIVQLDGDTFCAHKNFLYEVYCSYSNCYVNAFRYKKSDYSDLRGHYALSLVRRSSSNTWVQQCYWHTEEGKSLCNSLTAITELKNF